MSAVEAVNPWRPLGPCSTDACVSAPAVAAGTARLAARLAMAALVLAAGVPMSFAGRVRASWRAPLTMTWARLLVRALGVTIQITGDEEQAHGRAGGALVVANHVSWLDPLVVAATMPSRPLAKREIGEWPVIRTLAAGSGALFIDRERLSALLSAVAAVADALRAGDTVIAFPEGTTWCGRGMGHFRPAVFQAAVDAGAAVRPAVLRYREGTATSTRACYVGDDSLLASLLRVAATRDLAVEVTLLSPVRPAPAGGPQARAELARTALARTALARTALARTALARTAETTVRAGMEGARTHDRHPHPRPT